MTEFEKINEYLEVCRGLKLSSPDGEFEQNLYERWELKCRPMPFRLEKDVFELMGQSFKLLHTEKKTKIGYFRWDAEKNCASLIVETRNTEQKFLLRFRQGEPYVSDCGPSVFQKKAVTMGGQTELVYDVISHFRNTEGACEITELTKKKFLEGVEAVSEKHDVQTVKVLKALPFSEIRELLRAASSDMASDELSNQLSLALDGTYAVGHDDDGDKTIAGPVNVYHRSRWEIVRELDFISMTCRLRAENEKEFVLLFSSAVVVGPPDSRDLPLRINIEADAPLTQGDIIYVRRRKAEGLFGTFKVDIFDGDTVYGRLRCDSPGSAEKCFHELAGMLPRSPGEFLASNISHLCASVNDGKDGGLSPAQVFALGLKPFVFKPGSEEAPGKKSAEMDKSQLSAWRAATDAANPLVLVHGPPGTGKTFVLEQVLRKLCRQGLRVLATAPSNTAIDNICRRISDLPVLRFGNNPESIAPDVAKRSWVGNKAAVDRFVAGRMNFNGGIYAGTNVGLLRDKIVVDDMKRNGRYDAIVLDEAGMCSIEEFFLCAGFGKRAVLFGDHQQLPPFPLPKTVHLKLRDEFKEMPRYFRTLAGTSALEYLAELRKVPLLMLQHSYRCQNPRLLRFASTLFYDAVVRPSVNAEYYRLPYHERERRYPRSSMRLYSTSRLTERTRSEQLFFDGRKPGLANKTEALICAEIFYEAAKKYPLDEISVIAPYRKQVALIREILSLGHLNSLLEGKKISQGQWTDFISARIATVDSFQGGESDVVIICYVRSNKDEGIGFIDNPNRVNVAHTRCRREMHIVGDIECLKFQAKSEIFERLERAFRRDGELIEVLKAPKDSNVYHYTPESAPGALERDKAKV